MGERINALSGDVVRSVVFAHPEIIITLARERHIIPLPGYNFMISNSLNPSNLMEFHFNVS
jgi:hypothetical protein